MCIRDSYHAALGVYKKLRKKQQFEVYLDYLREFDFDPVTTIDEYFVKYDVPTAFTVRGKTVIVESLSLIHISCTRKRLVATASRREGVLGRTGEPSVTFLRKRRSKEAGEIGRASCRERVFRAV